MIFASALFIGNPTIDLKTVDSTNEYASSLILNEPISDGLVVCAKHQTAGKGQMGTQWLTSEGRNLTLSIILKPKSLHIKYQFYLSIIASLSIRDLLRKYHLKPKIKWPNDVYINSNKIAGILIQNTLIQSNIQYSVIGMGININQESFDPTIANPTSLALENKKTYDLIEIRKDLFSCFELYYIDLKEGRYEVLMSEYKQSIYQMNEVRSYKLKEGNIVNGIIRDVQENGLLDMQIGEDIKSFPLKEISFL